MKLFLILKPLRDPSSLQKGIVAGIVTLATYALFSVLSMAGAIGFGTMPIQDLLLFALVKAFSIFTTSDWIIFALFPLAGGLLFANYEYWKCKSRGAETGLLLGLFAATCPACILPILGLTALTTLAFRVGWFIKIAALLFVVAATYLVVYRQQKCARKN